MNFYNEIDPKAAAWLRELIKQCLIPNGVVDQRSITEIKPHELTAFTQCHFFAGIGGWSLALRLAGWDDSRPVWSGSCPCQPFSVAGKGKGVEDERHLWPVFAELIRECRPATVIGEQVASAAGREWLAGVFADLEGMGYNRAGADGKTRRIEPGLAPLVAGIPRGVVPSGDSCAPDYAQNTGEARVMRLRGYGNSIIPQLAAEFIQAFCEVRP